MKRLVSRSGGVLAAATAVVIAGCGGGGDVRCTPPPQIRSTPPTTATVGQTYGYIVDALYLCGFFVCGDFELVQGPAGAATEMSSKYLYWTPPPDAAGTNVRFKITVGPDSCGDRVSQTWTVQVQPAP